MAFTPSFNDIKLYINKDEILNKIREEDIYSRWCSEFPSRCFHSPLPGRSDANPSFGFFQLEDKWLWKDAGTNETGDVFSFVQKMENLTFEDTLERISNVFSIEASTPLMPRRVVVRSNDLTPINEEQRSKIWAVQRRLEDYDIKLWSKWNFSPTMMEHYMIRAADVIWKMNPKKDKEEKVWAVNKPDNPIYYFKSPYSNHIKAYRPLEGDKKKKWINNCDNMIDVMGYYQCRIKERPGQPMLLVKSMKEVGFFRSFGYNAVSNHSENSRFHPDFMRHLFKYCCPILSVYDPDPSGVLGAMQLRKLYDVPMIMLCQSEFKSKDPTDRWVENYHQVYKFLDRLNEMIQYHATRQYTPRSLSAAD